MKTVSSVYRSTSIKYYEKEDLYEIDFVNVNVPDDAMCWSMVSEDLCIEEGEILNQAKPIEMIISFNRETLPIEKD